MNDRMNLFGERSSPTLPPSGRARWQEEDSLGDDADETPRRNYQREAFVQRISPRRSSFRLGGDPLANQKEIHGGRLLHRLPSAGPRTSSPSFPAETAVTTTTVAENPPATFQYSSDLVEYQHRKRAEFLSTKLAAAHQDNRVLRCQLRSSEQRTFHLERNLLSERERSDWLERSLAGVESSQHHPGDPHGGVDNNHSLGAQIAKMTGMLRSNHPSDENSFATNSSRSRSGRSVEVPAPRDRIHYHDGPHQDATEEVHRLLQESKEDLASQLTEIKGMLQEYSNQQKKRKRSSSGKKKKKKKKSRSKSTQSHGLVDAAADGCVLM